MSILFEHCDLLLRGEDGAYSTLHGFLGVRGDTIDYIGGVTAKEVTDIAFHLGAWNSTRFDGGGSSAVWAKTQSKTGIISSPSDKGGERSCMNYIYVRTK